MIYALIVPFTGVVVASALTCLYALSLVRANESEADAMALTIMSRAGFDPRAAVRSLHHMNELEQAIGSKTFWQRAREIPLLRTHEPTYRRTQAVTDLLPQVLEGRERSTEIP